MTLHRGINMTSVAGDGLKDIPGLLIAIAFVFIFAGIFVPREWSNWFMALFLAVEAGAAILYVLLDRRERKESERLIREMHRMNE